MRFVSLLIICMCLLPTQPATAEEQERSQEEELTQLAILKPWTGDLDGMVARRVIRALVASSRTS
jgi:hypothetical protein